MKGAGGGKRGGRKPTRVESDDRPRGYEAVRMRQLWRDIDDAKHKAGLGPPPPPKDHASSSWDVTALYDRAAALVGDAAAWVNANAPAACTVLATGVELLRGVPVLGRLVELVPVPASARPDPGATQPHTADPQTNGVLRPAVVDPDEPDGPDGGWMH